MKKNVLALSITAAMLGFGVAGSVQAMTGALGGTTATSLALDGFKMCGSELNNPNMQLSLMALVVIPELRISDKGLVDVTRFDFVPVLED